MDGKGLGSIWFPECYLGDRKEGAGGGIETMPKGAEGSEDSDESQEIEQEDSSRSVGLKFVGEA